VRRVLRKIRNHRALNTTFLRFKKGPATVAQAQSQVKKGLIIR